MTERRERRECGPNMEETWNRNIRDKKNQPEADLVKDIKDDMELVPLKLNTSHCI